MTFTLKKTFLDVVRVVCSLLLDVITWNSMQHFFQTAMNSSANQNNFIWWLYSSTIYHTNWERQKKKNQNWPMKVSITFFSLIYQKLLMQIGKQGPGNHGGEGVVPPRIRDLYSEKNSKIFFLFIRTPLDKNHSKAPG